MISRGASLSSAKYSAIADAIANLAGLPISGFSNSLADNINSADMENINALFSLFKTIKGTKQLSKIGKNVAKAFETVGTSGGVKDVVDEYNKIVKKEKQKESYDKYLNIRSGSSRLYNLKETYGTSAYSVFRTEFEDAKRQIENPEYAHLLELQHQWGSRKGSELYHLEKNTKEEKVRKEADDRFNYDMMDEFDQKMHDLTERYGGDSVKADAKIRKELEKNLPSFFKGSRLSTRDLHALTKSFSSIGNIPVVGGFVKGMSLNPITTAIAGALALSHAHTSATREVTSWESAERYYGRPSNRFLAAMLYAGVGNEGAVSKKYAAMGSWLADLRTGVNGAYDIYKDVAIASNNNVDLSGIDYASTPEEVLETIAPQLNRLNKQEKISTLNALRRIGIDESVMRGGEFLAGTEIPSESNVILGRQQHLIDESKRKFKSNPFNPLNWAYIIPYIGELGAKLDATLGYGSFLDDDADLKYIPKIVSVATPGSPSGNFYIQNMEVIANDAKEFNDSMQKESESRSNKNTLRQMNGGMH